MARRGSLRAESIVRSGFTDVDALLVMGEVHRGVWLTSVPPDASQDAADVGQLLEIHLPPELATRYEYYEATAPYRQFLIPADVLAEYGPPRLLTPEEEAGSAAVILPVRRRQA